MGHPVQWFKGLDEKSKERLKLLLENNSYLIDNLARILDDREKEITTQETTLNDYMGGDWQFRQAHRNGMRQVIKEMRILFNINK